jgi:hypothetical protein
MITRSSPNSGRQSVNVRWSLEWKLTSLAHGDSYKVIDPDLRRNLVVWISRAPLDREQQKAFRQHIGRVRSAGALPLVAEGVDSSGIGYVALELDAYMSLDSDRPGAEKLRMRFIECAAKIAALHEQGVAVGNISAGSFVLNHHQEVEFVGVLGGFAVSEITKVPPEVRACLPRGALKAHLQGSRADVYALAVLGLKLFGAQFPPSGIKPEEVDRYVERLVSGAPRWVSEVLKPIIKEPERSSLRDAGDLLSLCADVERSSATQQPDSDGSYTATERTSQNLQLSVHEIARRARHRGAGIRGGLWRRTMRNKAAQVVVCCLLLGTAFQANLIPIGRFFHVGSWFGGPKESAPPLRQQQLEVSLREEHHRAEMPVADLIARFRTTPSDLHYQQLWEGVSYDLKAKGFDSAAAVAQGTVRPQGHAVQESATLADLMSPHLSPQERVEKLRSYDALDPEFATQVAAAFAADEHGDREVYRDFLIMSVRKFLPSPMVGKLADRSTSALIVASSLKGDLGSDTQTEIVRELPPADLWWLLELYATKRSSQVALLTDLVLSRGICQGLRCTFLSLMRNSELSPDTPYDALINSARFGVGLRDVERFTRWLAPQSEQALYMVSLTSSEHVVVKAALEGLQSKPQLDELVVAVINALGAHQQDALFEYASLVSALGVRTSMPPEVLKGGLGTLRDEPLRTQIAKQILTKGESAVIIPLLSIHGAALHPNILLPLMEHKDPDVRMAALPFLKGLPLASSRATLERLYAKEQDLRVKAAYEREVFSQ